jgi:uncharacterized protein (TIGR03435 family)
VESPLACVSGISGFHLKRIEAIMNNRMAVSLNFTKKTILAFAGAVALAAPFVVGLMHAPAIRAQSSPAATPKFEVVSIKPCSGEPAPVPGRKGSRGGRVSASPGRLTAECATLATLVRAAYIQFAEGTPPAFISPRIMQQEIKGRPSWYDSDRFTIDATTQGPQPREVLMGPMLQALLEERFKLQTHRETRDVPIYELKVAKGGPKLQAAKEGKCAVFDRNNPPPEPGSGGLPICGGFAGEYMYGTTMENLSRQLTVLLDRDVVDKTDLAEKFDIHFEWSPDEITTGTPGPPADPAAFRSKLASDLEAAIPRLGLVLQPAKGSSKFLVIDHVEKPAEN